MINQDIQKKLDELKETAHLPPECDNPIFIEYLGLGGPISQ